VACCSFLSTLCRIDTGSISAAVDGASSPVHLLEVSWQARCEGFRQGGNDTTALHRYSTELPYLPTLQHCKVSPTWLLVRLLHAGNRWQAIH